MRKAGENPDVLVLGDHPCTYLAAAFLKTSQTSLRVLHAPLSKTDAHDRLLLVNPAFFDLHKSLAAVKSALHLTPVHGLTFLADDPATRREHSTGAPAAFVVSAPQLHAECVRLAQGANVQFSARGGFCVHELDEAGVEIELGGKRLHPRLLIVGGELSAACRRMLGLQPGWDTGVVHHYTYLKLSGRKWLNDAHARQSLVPMSLDLKGALYWGWLLSGKDATQVSVLQPIGSASKLAPADLLAHWVDVLVQHGLLTSRKGIDPSAAITLDLPLAGALAQEGIANRTLLIGPAGGFYSACAEDIYPNCWSALCAAEVARKALAEKHLQDALHAYRQKWGAGLGDFLRGPQQNLRFLMTLVYRNPTMAARITEAILLGKSVVR